MKQEHPTHSKDSQPTHEPPQPTQPAAPVAPPVQVYQQVQSNPGQGLGIASIILGIFMIWLVGLPLGIISIIKSRNANASAVLGIIGTVLNVLAILGSIILLTIGIVAAQNIDAKRKTVEASAQKLKDETLAATKGTTYTFSQDFTSSALYWSVSMPPSWTIKTLDKNGINQFSKPGTQTMFTTYQLRRDGLASGESDLVASKAYIDEYIASMKQQGAGTVTIDSTSTVVVPFLENSDKLEMHLAKMSYSTRSGNYTTWLAVRVVSNAIVAVQYAGATSDVTETEWQSLLARVSVTEI